jgi:acyl-CoA synthetase (AMP-forming)/AMP-acid ligase II
MTTFSMAALGAPRVDVGRDRLAVIHGAERLTYDELDRRADLAASALSSSGVEPGDHVGYLGLNSAGSIELLIGCARIGAVGVYYNWRLAPRELAVVLADSAPDLLVCDAMFVPLAAAAAGELVDPPRLVVRSGAGDIEVPTGAVEYDRWMTSGTGAVPPVQPSSDDVAVQLYTSGTTGVPKGARLTHRGFAAAMPDTAGFWGLDGDSRVLSVLPMFHIAGIGTAAATLWAGGTLVIADDASAAATLRDIETHGLTHIILASVMLQALVDAPEFPAADLRTLRTVSYGAAPISESVLATVLDRLDCAVMQPYGLTETTGVLTLLTADDHRAALADGGDPSRLRTCGTARPGVELRVVEPTTGVDVEPGEPGELWARSERIMSGYWNRAEQTAEVLVGDGWFRTGDVAVMDADGYVELRDRLNDMIISGGENVYPVEVENVIQAHPDVAHVAVIGVPHDRWGETPVAAIVPEPGRDLDPDDVIAFARDRLAHYKCPTAVHVVDTLPRNATGKVLRKELRSDASWLRPT